MGEEEFSLREKEIQAELKKTIQDLALEVAGGDLLGSQHVVLRLKEELHQRGYVRSSNEHTDLTKVLDNYWAWSYLIGSTPGLTNPLYLDLPGEDSIVSILREWKIEKK